MLRKRWFVGALLVALLIGANAGHAQVSPKSPPSDTVRAGTAERKAEGTAAPKSHAVKICLDCHGWGRTSDVPAMVFKDAEYRVVMMTAPGDTLAALDPAARIEPAWIAKIDIVKPAEAVAALGRGFEKGIVIVVLTPAGSDAWRQRHAPLKAPPPAQ